MATKKKPTEAVEEVAAKIQDQYMTAVEQGQTMMIDAYKAWVDTMAKVEMPTIPGLAEAYEIRADYFDGMFDLGAAMLDNQRAFTKKVLEVAGTAQG